MLEDYFGTLAALLDLVRQNGEKYGYTQEDANLLERKKDELIYCLPLSPKLWTFSP